MSFKNSYNLNVLAGYGDNTAYDADTNLARCTAVAEWINTNLGDIFEASVDTNDTTQLWLHYKGTNSGLYVKVSALTATTSGYNVIGISHNGTKVNIQSGVRLIYSEVNLLVIKSKYGVIAGLYKDSVAGNILTMGINNFDGTFVSLVLNSSTMYVSTQASSENTVTLPVRGTSEQAVLSKFNVPTIDTVPDGVYMSTGASSNNCGIFTVGGGTDKYCEVANGSTYVGYALLLEEPEEGDYIS